ncbi:hypothetical protein [Neobacillus mesonae]|uniref:hypothetical protein n=1 Tax=Neobacillus mesonae TaxID=1193713 RepID=UPI002040D776|nr:hypothetical protein [Neobacillus mesonae]MCM3567865.1 hypothetical protein [Neobacillus mesonae]
MAKTIDAIELGKKIGVEVVRNKIKIKAINELLIEKGIYTQEEINKKFSTLLEDKTLTYVRELLDLSEEEFTEEDIDDN